MRCDSTGKGDFPTEYLRDHSSLPLGEESAVEFSSKTKNEVYTLYKAALFREPSDPERFSYWQDDPLATALEDQMAALLREYTGNGEFLSPHAPDEPGCFDDAYTMGR